MKKQIVCIHWNNEHISKLCEKWIRCGCEYAHTWCEEPSTSSGEVLSTREHKTTMSKRKSNKKTAQISITCECLKNKFNINR